MTTALIIGAVALQMLCTATFVAFHNVAILVFWVRSSSKTLTGGSCSVSFTFALKERKLVVCVVGKVRATEGSSFSKTFSCLSEGSIASPIRSGGATCVSPPNPLVLTILVEQMLGCICVAHVANVWSFHILLTIIRRGGR